MHVLLGGTSHAGKSGFAASLGGEVISTDALARHPGRPWPQVPPHVAEFYTHMSASSIYTFLLHHHQNMWPRIEALLVQRARAGRFCVWEGNALRPELMATLPADAACACFCLYAPDRVIESRIHSSCAYASLPPQSKVLVDAFVARALRDNRAQLAAAQSHGIEVINTEDRVAVEELHRQLRGASS